MVNPLNITRLKPNAALLLSMSVESVYDTLYKRIKIDNVHRIHRLKKKFSLDKLKKSKLQAYVSNRMDVI